MDNKKRNIKLYSATWEDYGETTPVQIFTHKDWLQSRLSKEPEVPFLNQTRDENPLRIPDDVRTRSYEQLKDVQLNTPQQHKAKTFGEKAQIDVENFLWDIGLGKSQAGELGRELLPPVVSNIKRIGEGVTQLFNSAESYKGIGNLALGTLGGAFGIAMTPFTIIKKGFEEVGGEKAGKIAEIGSLGIAGGIPLIAGYFASEGMSDLAEKISKNLELTPKEAETVQEVTGLVSFTLGTKLGHTGQKYIRNKTNTYLNKKVEGYLDKIFPNTEKTKISGRGELTGLKETDLWGTDVYERERKPYEAPPETIGEKINTGNARLDKLTDLEPKELVLTPEQKINLPSVKQQKIADIENQMRQAEKNNNEALWNELNNQRKEIAEGKKQKNGKVKIQEVKNPETPIEEVRKKSIREQRREKILQENTDAINKILEESPELSSSQGIRTLSKRLNSLVTQGKLSDKIDTETIKMIAEEWNKNRKVKPQEIKSPETPIEEIHLKDFYGKNAGVTVGQLLKENPEWADLIKDQPRENIYKILSKAWENKKATKVNEGEPKTGGEVVEPTKEQLKDYPDLQQKPVGDKIATTGKPEIKEDDQQLQKDLDDIFDINKSLREQEESILKEIEKFSRKQGNKTGALGGNIEPELFKLYLQYGRIIFEKGVRSSEKFISEFNKKFGEEKIAEQVWGIVNNNITSSDTAIKNWIGKNKGLLNLELKKVDNKIINPTTGGMGGAKHIAKRRRSIIEFNENTQGGTWYHELAHAIMRKNPELLNQFKNEINKLAESEKPINEKFADVFEEIFTNPGAPRTRLKQRINELYNIPNGYELARKNNTDFPEFTPPVERTKGQRTEHTADWLDKKYDAPLGVTEEISKVQNLNAYKKLRDDGTKKFAETLAESDLYQDITKENLLKLDPNNIVDKEGNPRIYNDAQQMRIERIMLNDALEVSYLSRQLKDNLNRESALEYKRRVEELIILKAIHANNGRELARALTSRRRRNTLSPEEYQEINEGINLINKKLGKDSGDLSIEMKKSEGLLNPTLKDKASYIWYNLALSNPLTDIANIGGNVSSVAFIMATHPISGTKAFIHTYLTDRSAWRNVGKIMRGEQHTISKYTEQTLPLREEIISPKTKGGNYVKHILLPTERLKVEDAIFRSFFETLAKEKSAKILAKELGVNKNEVIKVYNDFINNRNSIDKLVSTWGEDRFIKDVEGIERWAAKMVFQEPLGENIGRPIQKALNVIFPLNLLTVPFLRIAVNLGKISLEASPYGLTKLIGREIAQKYFGKEVKEMTKFEQRDLLQRAVLGTVFYTSLMAILNNSKFELTGDAPRDKNLRELWEKAGYRENSFIYNHNDGSKTVISYNNISPFNVLLGGIGTLMTKAKYGKAKEESIFANIGHIVLGMANAFGNQSFLQRTSTLLDILNKGDGDQLEKFLIQSIPIPNILSLSKGSPDLEALGIGERPNIYDTKGLVESIKNKIGMTKDLITRPDVFGGDMKSTYFRFPIPTTEKVDKIAQFMSGHGLTIGDPDNPKENGKEIFGREEFNQYNKLYRRNFYLIMNEYYDYLSQIIDAGEYGDEITKSIINNIKDQARELAKAKIQIGETK